MINMWSGMRIIVLLLCSLAGSTSMATPLMDALKANGNSDKLPSETVRHNPNVLTLVKVKTGEKETLDITTLTAEHAAEFLPDDPEVMERFQVQMKDGLPPYMSMILTLQWLGKNKTGTSTIVHGAN